MVCVNETFLNRSIQSVTLEGYALVGRRGRQDGRFGGGVLVFVREDCAAVVILSHISETAERIWCIIHSDRGPIALCSWYRPPCPGEIDSIVSFEQEWLEQKRLCVGCIAAGDVNVHSERFLKYSNGETTEGRAMSAVCANLQAVQSVKGATRGEYLLDLIITDLPDVKASILPQISDHAIVEANVEMTVPTEEVYERHVWDFRDADWAGLCDTIHSQYATGGFGSRCADPGEAARQLTGDLLAAMERNIPRRVIKQRKSSRPWLTRRALRAVAAKSAASGTPREAAEAERCSRTLLEERHRYAEKMQKEVKNLKRGSKRWWATVAQLTHKSQKPSSIPALKTPDGVWLLDARDKANHLSDVFEAKQMLPPPPALSAPVPAQPGCAQAHLPPLQT